MRRRWLWRRGRFGRFLMLDSAALLMFGAVGAANAYKIQRDQVSRIEQDTGKPLDTLTEQDLLDAMRRLGIQKLALDPDDNDAIADAGEPAP